MAAAAPLDPLNEVRACLQMVGFGANGNRFITVHNITSMDDFEDMSPEEVEQIIKMYNDCQVGQAVARKVGFLVQKKLKGLLYWYHDKLRRQQPIVAADFDASALRGALNDMKVENASKDAEDVEITVGQIETGMDWWKWKARFIASLENKRDGEGIPLARVIREQKPAGWTVAQATSKIERLIYQATMAGDAYQKANAKVWAELQKHIMEDAVYAWIREYDDTKDGRGGGGNGNL